MGVFAKKVFAVTAYFLICASEEAVAKHTTAASMANTSIPQSHQNTCAVISVTDSCVLIKQVCKIQFSAHTRIGLYCIKRFVHSECECVAIVACQVNTVDVKTRLSLQQENRRNPCHG